MRGVPYAASSAIERRMRLCRIRFSAEWFCERGLLTAIEVELRKPAACTQLFQEIASWLSLATRSKASVELLIRYLQLSPSVESIRITSYVLLAAVRAT